MRYIILIMSLGLLISCNDSSDGKSTAGNVSTGVDQSNLFKQYFEMEHLQFTDFTQCQFDVPCTEAYISELYDPEYGGLMECQGTILARPDGTIHLSEFVGTDPECADFFGDYTFKVIECQNYPWQQIFKCGEPDYPYDLVVEKIQ